MSHGLWQNLSSVFGCNNPDQRLCLSYEHNQRRSYSVLWVLTQTFSSFLTSGHAYSSCSFVPVILLGGIFACTCTCTLRLLPCLAFLLGYVLTLLLFGWDLMRNIFFSMFSYSKESNGYDKLQLVFSDCGKKRMRKIFTSFIASWDSTEFPLVIGALNIAPRYKISFVSIPAVVAYNKAVSGVWEWKGIQYHQSWQLSSRKNFLKSGRDWNLPEKLETSSLHQKVLHFVHLRPDAVVDFVPLYSVPDSVLMHSRPDIERATSCHHAKGLEWHKKPMFLGNLGQLGQIGLYLRKYKYLVKVGFWGNVAYCMGVWMVGSIFEFENFCIVFRWGPKFGYKFLMLEKCSKYTFGKDFGNF